MTSFKVSFGITISICNKGTKTAFYDKNLAQFQEVNIFSDSGYCAFNSIQTATKRSLSYPCVRSLNIYRWRFYCSLIKSVYQSWFVFYLTTNIIDQLSRCSNEQLFPIHIFQFLISGIIIFPHLILFVSRG